MEVTDDQLEQQIRLTKRLLAIEEAKRDLMAFIKFTMPDPEDPENTDKSLYQETPQARLLCDMMQKAHRRQIRRQAVSISPQMGKSQVISKHAIAWMFGQNPRAHFIVACYNETFAGETGGEVRDIINSPAYRQVFPDMKLEVGQTISGTGIPLGATIASIDVGAKTFSIAPMTCTASGTVTAEFVGCGEYISSITDRINGYTAVQTTAAYRPPYMPGLMAGRSCMANANNLQNRGTLVCSDLAMTSALDSAGQDMTLAITFQVQNTGSIASQFGFGAGNIALGLNGTRSINNRSFHGVSETLGNYERGVPHYLVITKIGTAVTLRRNGVVSGSGTWTKALTASTSFCIGASNPSVNQSQLGCIGLFYAANTGFTGSNLTDLEAWLAKKTGRA